MNPPSAKSNVPMSAGVAVNTDEADLSTISIASRVPEFWSELPRLWFAQFEATLNPQKQGDDCKYQLVISKLTREALQQVSDIVFNPPDTNKYTAIKDRLLQVYEESSERQFQKLVGEIDLGSQKPSQLLRRMKELARNCQASDETVHNLWTARLPSAVRAVLTVSQDQKLDNLAAIADKVMESLQQGQLGTVAVVSNTPVPCSSTNELVAGMNQLMLEVASLRNEVQRNGQRRSGFRGRSRSRGMNRSRSNTPNRTPSSPDWLCFFHYRYGDRARRCEEPCNWQRKSEN